MQITRRLTPGIRPEKCVVRRFRRRANVIECSYTNLVSIAHYTPRPVMGKLFKEGAKGKEKKKL